MRAPAASSGSARLTTGLMYDNRHRKNTYASSTPVTDGRLVYAYFEAAGIYAYDFDGALAWSSSLGKIAKGGMGPGTSPILFEDLVIVQADQEMGAGSAMVALDKRTGKEVWRTARTTRRSWATPLIVEANKRVELIAAGAEMVAGYDPRSGRELWRSRGTESHPIPSAVAGLGLIFFTAGSQAKRAMAVRPGGDGDVTSSAIVWSYRKGTAYVPSPILHGSFLYLMTDAGLMTCLDAATGEVKYEGGRPPVPATFTSSLVAYGDRLLMTSEDGDTFVVKAGPIVRGAADELGRRARVCVAGAGQQHHLYSRRQTPVCDPVVRCFGCGRRCRNSNAQLPTPSSQVPCERSHLGSLEVGAWESPVLLQQMNELPQDHRRRAPDVVAAEIEVGVLDRQALAIARAGSDARGVAAAPRAALRRSRRLRPRPAESRAARR